jgi:hypothetical protein
MARGLLYLVKADFVADALGSFREAFDEFTKENLTPEQAVVSRSWWTLGGAGSRVAWWGGSGGEVKVGR